MFILTLSEKYTLHSNSILYINMKKEMDSNVSTLKPNCQLTYQKHNYETRKSTYNEVERAKIFCRHTKQNIRILSEINDQL